MISLDAYLDLFSPRPLYHFQCTQLREGIMANSVVWVDIPVLDLDRAIKFYSSVIGAAVTRQEFPGMAMGILPHDDGVGGCLFTKEGERPSERGPLVYLNVQGRLDQAIAAVQQLGGKILEPKHGIPPHGYRAIIKDSEGNRLALHSM
jgi:predicted enzyme related to lactoylglutathione lyase